MHLTFFPGKLVELEATESAEPGQQQEHQTSRSVLLGTEESRCSEYRAHGSTIHPVDLMGAAHREAAGQQHWPHGISDGRVLADETSPAPAQKQCHREAALRGLVVSYCEYSFWELQTQSIAPPLIDAAAGTRMSRSGA